MVSYDIPKGNETTKPWQIRENGTDKKFIAQPKITLRPGCSKSGQYYPPFEQAAPEG